MERGLGTEKPANVEPPHDTPPLRVCSVAFLQQTRYTPADIEWVEQMFALPEAGVLFHRTKYNEHIAGSKSQRSLTFSVWATPTVREP